jgi:translation initiation factor IF-3
LRARARRRQQPASFGDSPIRQDSRPAPSEQYRVNHRIRIPRVRVIASDGAQIGILDTHEALRMAREEGLDLVEISPKAVPPVCKIMDYGRFKYETAKKEREERSKRTVIEVKEMKFRPKTDDHDFDFKVKHIREFLGEGNKAKLVIQFRGREIVHPEVGQDVLRRVVAACADVGQVEQAPMMEGRRMLMIIGPKGGNANKPKPPVAPAAPAIAGAGAGAVPGASPTAPTAAAPAAAAAPATAAAPAAVAASVAPAAAKPATATPAEGAAEKSE